MWKKITWVHGGLSIVVLSVFAIAAATIAQAAEKDALQSCAPMKDAYCFAPSFSERTAPLHATTMPKVATPAWMNAPSAPRVVTYRVEPHGSVSADMAEFRDVAAATLNDPRGWSRLGVRFDRVDAGGDFVLYLAQAATMTDFSATGCDTTYSCNVGNNVIVNEDRWKAGSPSWNEAGANLEGYRQMVINHETGHWLGHGHRYCGGPGQEAPVMQQQSMGMQGCVPNAWPQASEMYAPKLGIRS